MQGADAERILSCAIFATTPRNERDKLTCMEPLTDALSRPEAYPHATGKIEVVETHISWIFLSGRYAYKVKKPVNLGFLDFSTLAKRHHYCNEELRLNQRLCPDIYLSVVPIVKSGSHFLIDVKEGDIIEYAVKMLRFDRTMELDRMVAAGRLKQEQVDILSSLIAGFHQSLAASPLESEFGKAENLIKPILHNFEHMEPASSEAMESMQIEALKEWTLQEHQRLYHHFLERKSGGFIRQCHGDMHSGNMVWWRGGIAIFDCIEFSESLSIIDVISDLAFLFMDLEHAGRADFAWRILNNYLSVTGDYAALPLLRFYSVYRAMVRAKVTAIRYSQTTEKYARERALQEHSSYIRLAEHYCRREKPLLVLTMGVSGSGKTTVSREIAQRTGCVLVRSDVERKRLAGLPALRRSSIESKSSLYTEEMNRKTTQRLLDIATLCITEGIAVIVDATLLKGATRKLFMELSSKHNTPCLILHYQAPLELLMARVRERYRKGDDASEADTEVLALQLESEEALNEEEQAICITINTAEEVDLPAIAEKMDMIRKENGS